MDALNRYGPLIGRLLIAVIFVLSGFNKIAGFEGTVGYIASKGLPLPQLGAILAIVVELGGGILLIVGWKTRWAAAVMMIFTVVAAVIFHNYWAAPPEMAQNQMIHFMKNLAIAGGFLSLVLNGAGGWSVDG